MKKNAQKYNANDGMGYRFEDRGALGSEAVATRAYELWQSEGSQHGRDQEYWFRAERELRDSAGRSRTPQGISRDVDRGKLGSGE